MHTSSLQGTAATPHIVNAYLESKNTIVASLSQNITLPCSISNALITDMMSGEQLEIAAIDTIPIPFPVLVGDLQHLLGAQYDWNPTEDATLLRKINNNLYQFKGTLPAGTYHYKIAFNRDWDGVQPSEPIVLTVPPDGAKVTFSYIPFELKSQQQQIYDSLNNPTASLPLSSAGLQTSLIQLTLENDVDITRSLQLTLRGFSACKVIARGVLNSAEYTYTGTDLGNTFSPQRTTFRVWAPTASDVQLRLYNSETGLLTRNVDMQRGEKGTWYVEIRNNLENWYYLYQVTTQGTTQTAVDPYVRAIAVNAARGMIVDLAKTNPDGWNKDRYQQLADPVDAIIYELHVRDFSIHDSSGMNHKGQYLAFTERGTKGPNGIVTGVDSLKQLGITHVQVLPIAEFASVDENDPSQYNWGYDPRNYNVPEGAYASTPHSTARITELKRMIQSLHASQLGVIMDVVYNHTFATINSDFDKLVPQYYYRTNDAGYYTNGSGVGNELATERPMVQKFVRDSITYWIKEYHVDGFRFDLMALIGVETMSKVAQDMYTINPHGLLYGEPWTGGGSALPDGQLLYKGRQKNLGIGVFNDNIRNAITGGALNATEQGFATGNPGTIDTLKRGIEGSINDFTDAPGETINYVTSHDNYTLWDKIAACNGELDEEQRIRMDKLAQAIVFTAQGVAFMQGGEEFLRTKDGNDNSYNAGDGVNKFDWSRKAHYQNIFNYYASLIQLRKNHPVFRMTSADEIRENLTFLESPANMIAFLLNGRGVDDSWGQTLVIHNANTTDTTFRLPHGTWNVVVNLEQAGEQILGRVMETVTVTAITCMVLYRNDITGLLL